MLFCVATLPVAIVFQQRLLPDEKDEGARGSGDRGRWGCVILILFFMGCRTCPSWHWHSLSSPSFLYSFSLSMISMKKPWITFPTWETHLSGDVNAWLPLLPVGFKRGLLSWSWNADMVEWPEPNTGFAWLTVPNQRSPWWHTEFLWSWAPVGLQGNEACGYFSQTVSLCLMTVQGLRKPSDFTPVLQHCHGFGAWSIDSALPCEIQENKNESVKTFLLGSSKELSQETEENPDKELIKLVFLICHFPYSARKLAIQCEHDQQCVKNL